MAAAGTGTAAAGSHSFGLRLLRRVGRDLALVGGALCVTAGVGLTAAHYVLERLDALAELPAGDFLLELDLEQMALVEHAPAGGVQALLQQQQPTLELAAVVEALTAAGADQRVRGVLALMGDGAQQLGLAQVQELRDAVASFRQAGASRGAVSVAYADAFGEGGAGGTGAYLLASAFERCYMQPTGLLSATGLAATVPFARGLLDRWKIQPLFFRREAYKSAASFMTGSDFTGPERRATSEMLQCLGGQIVSDIAAARGLTERQVRSAIDAAPHLAEKAEQLGLVDGLLYRDQASNMVAHLHEHRLELLRLMQDLQGNAPGQPPYTLEPEALAAADRGLLGHPDLEPAIHLRRVSVATYAASLQRARRKQLEEAGFEDEVPRGIWGRLRWLMRPGGEEASEEAGAAAAAEDAPGHKPTVALLKLVGPIYLGRGDSSPLPLKSSHQGYQLGSLPVIQALRGARKDASVKAVVLRLDSPGGSAAASDAIHREVLLLRKAGKAVVVSMGNTAASGGYYISCPASKIVAQPATLTGSIGVLAGKLVVSGLLAEYGITPATVKEGANADAMSAFTGLTRAQTKHLENIMDSTYSHFLARVVEGRGMSLPAVREVAQGRVWTGRQALERGLVDELGGLQRAIELAKQEAGLPLEEGAVLVRQVYPRQESLFKLLAGRFAGRDSEPAATAQLQGIAAALGLPPALLQSLLAQRGILGQQLMAPEAAHLAQLLC